ncbi:MAG TPA: peptidyl-prolyl cis-trans isomerase [Terriglobales bacterium]|nr:peptidyl-prolyl cis-trans isomerase [Terriglobales bacterium]
MQFRCLPVLLLASLALGQAAPAPTSKKAAPKSPAASTPAKPAQPTAKDSSGVAPETPVITITGVCDRPAARTKAAPAPKTKADCKTVVTRAQFEEIANALQPNMNAAMKKRLADIYPKMLVLAQEARKRGLENDPRFKQILQFARLQILAQQLSQSVKDDADKVPEAEIAKYYKDNAGAFEQADFQRLYIPKDKQREPAADSKEDPAKQADTQKADEEAMKKEADSLQTRAAGGEDFDKLQKEAFDVAGVKSAPPSTKIGKLTRNELPVNHRTVLDLKAGQVSQVLAEPNGYYIYKVVAKETKPLDQAHDQIRATLAQQRMQDAMESIQQSSKTDLNEAYFGPASAPAAVPGGAPPPPPQVNPPAKPETSKDQDKGESPTPKN